MNRTILIAASFLLFQTSLTDVFAEALQAGWRPVERQLPLEPIIFEIRMMIEDRAEPSIKARGRDKRFRGPQLPEVAANRIVAVRFLDFRLPAEADLPPIHAVPAAPDE